MALSGFAIKDVIVETIRCGIQ